MMKSTSDVPTGAQAALLSIMSPDISSYIRALSLPNSLSNTYSPFPPAKYVGSESEILSCCTK